MCIVPRAEIATRDRAAGAPANCITGSIIGASSRREIIRIYLMYVAHNHSVHLALRYWLIILPRRRRLRSVPPPSIAPPFPCPVPTEPPPPLNVYAYLCGSSFQEVTRSEINFVHPGTPGFLFPRGWLAGWLAFTVCRAFNSSRADESWPIRMGNLSCPTTL